MSQFDDLGPGAKGVKPANKVHEHAHLVPVKPIRHRNRGPAKVTLEQHVLPRLPGELPVGKPQANTDAGRLKHSWPQHPQVIHAHWGTVHDLAVLSHGAAGCGYFALDDRMVTRGHAGVTRFESLNITSDFTTDDIESGGDAKLDRCIDEANELFPLSRGMIVLSLDPVIQLDSDIRAVTHRKMEQDRKLTVALPAEHFRQGGFDYYLRDSKAATWRAADMFDTREPGTPYDVALIYTRPGPALISEVRRLLTAIGLNVVACGSHCASEDFAGRLKEVKLALGFGQKLGMTAMYDRHPFASAQEKRFGIPWMWSCFVSPRATAESLRAIARRFDAKIEAKAEDVIGAHAALVEATIARYRPALEGRLVLEFSGLGADELEPLQMLGMRLGNAKGWTKKDGSWRTPRKPCAYPMPSDEGLLALLREAEPDLVIGTGWDQFEARKRGYCAWVPSRAYKQAPFGYWGFRGFADFAADIDRIVNATWRGLTASKIGAVSPQLDLSE